MTLVLLLMQGRTSGGHGLLEALPRIYQVTPDIPDRRRATKHKEVRPSPADSLNESQLAARSGPSPPRRTPPTAQSKQQASMRHSVLGAFTSRKGRTGRSARLGGRAAVRPEPGGSALAGLAAGRPTRDFPPGQRVETPAGSQSNLPAPRIRRTARIDFTRGYQQPCCGGQIVSP